MENVHSIDSARKLDFSGYDVPLHTQGALERYMLRGFEPGSFLMAVLSNDLFGAISRADSENKPAIQEIVAWLYNRAPRNSWGSWDNYKNHLAKFREEEKAQ